MIKTYTNIEQSHKLEEILPSDSADLSWIWNEENQQWIVELFPYSKIIFPLWIDRSKIAIPCWSLSELLTVIPVVIDYSNKKLRLRMDKSEKDFSIWYEDMDTCLVEEELDVSIVDIVDACYEMIVKLNQCNISIPYKYKSE